MDLRKANENLEKALLVIPSFDPENLSDKHKSQISKVILGRHLTFRYILITALLAKVTDPLIHMRSLQAGADLYGAYDARSLCHKVWVPFEQTKLNSKLGGSNEPYLNKPARFPEIETTNAVRRGYDQDLLNTMYGLLEDLNDADEDLHLEAFLYAMKLIDGRSEGLVHEISLPTVRFTQFRTMAFINTFLGECKGGESAAATTGAIFRILYSKKNMKVIIHPVCQAGSSSNEIGDVDIRRKKDLVMAIEVKDKQFAESDINHAIRKVLESGNTRLLFLIGRHAQPFSSARFIKISEERAKKGADVSFDFLDELCKRMTSIFSEDERKNVILNIAAILDEMRATDATKAHFKSCLKRLKQKQ
ncbi:restriction endonuclease, SacI family [Thermodesulfobacteriota bacterium]